MSQSSTSQTILNVAAIHWISNPVVLVGSIVAFLAIKIFAHTNRGRIDHGFRSYQAYILNDRTGEPIDSILKRWSDADKAAGKPVWPAEFKMADSPY